MQRVEHGEVALTGDAERQLDPVHDELVDEELAARSHVRTSGCSKYTVGFCSLGRLVVGRVDVADRALAGPLCGQDQHADEGGRLVL